MRMGELLESHVYDVDGRRIGKVHDVRLIQDGPERGRFGRSLRVDGLVVGHGALAIRLGYHRAGVRGPFLLGRIFRRLEGRAHYVPWDRIASHDDERVDLSCPASDLPRVPDLG
jgi:hypothetical protein